MSKQSHNRLSLIWINFNIITRYLVTKEGNLMQPKCTFFKFREWLFSPQILENKPQSDPYALIKSKINQNVINEQLHTWFMRPKKYHWSISQHKGHPNEHKVPISSPKSYFGNITFPYLPIFINWNEDHSWRSE